MTMSLRPTWTLLAVGALALAACSEEVAGPETATTPDTPMLAKGGGGKPGGGGGGGGGGPTPTAEIAFHYNGAVWAMNADGSNRTELLTNGCAHSYTSWAPSGSGASSSPFHFINFSICGPMTIADVDTVGGSVHVGNVQQLHLVGDVYDTGISGAPLYGYPAWSPGNGAEIALTGSWQADPVTNEWRDALYIIAAGDLPNPTPQLLYEPPAGCGLNGAAWSPDGGMVAWPENCGTGGWAIKAISRATGTVTTLLPAGTLDASGGLTWSRSGDQLAFTTSDQWVYALRLEPGAVPVVVERGLGPSWSPDPQDSQLIFTTSGAKRKLRIFDFTTGTGTTFGNGEFPVWR